jgi:polyhydroxyalkanoate synthesis regulator phasin
MPKYLKTAFVRELEQQVRRGELSHTRMLDLIQDEVIKNYTSTFNTREMKTDDIIKHLKLQDSSLDFYEQRVERLEQQISDIKSISNLPNSVDLDLNNDQYSKQEIINAYNKMLKYEGISKDRIGGLIIDTFIKFLNNTHHSTNEK